MSQTVRAACAELDPASLRILTEPGRSIVGPAGITLYTVGGVKEIHDVGLQPVASARRGHGGRRKGADLIRNDL